MNPVLEDRLARLDEITLEGGSHPAPDNGAVHGCAMEWVAYIAGEKWSDNPQCVSPTIGAFLRRWNDDLDDEGRQMLKPLLPKVIGTANGKRAEIKRGWMCADWMIRVHTPAWLELAGLDDQATVLRNLPEIRGVSGLGKTQPKLDAAGDAARDAAGAAAGAAEGAALAPTVDTLKTSALALLETMIKPEGN